MKQLKKAIQHERNQIALQGGNTYKKSISN